MARRLDFIVSSLHNFTIGANNFITLPALPGPASPRLYVIWSNLHVWQAYIGTSSNVALRFSQRLRVLNEFGFNLNQIHPNIFVYLVRIEIENQHGNMQSVTVSDTGKITDLISATWINVEHLLARMYVNEYGFGVRNIQLWAAPFINPLNVALDVHHYQGNGVHIAGFNNANFGIAANTAY